MKKHWKIIALSSVTLCMFGLSGCGSSSGGSSSSGTHSILTGGGLGGNDGGTGGDGNYFDVENDYGTGGNIVISGGGSADASFAPSSFTPYYGTNPLTISANTTIAYEDTTEPVTGTVYLGTDNSIYISDGDGTLGPADANELPVTGVLVKAAATVTFGVTGTADLSLVVDNDFVNYGTITTANQAVSDRGDLNIQSGSFQNFGTIALNATADEQNGGDLDINSSSGGSLLNHGVINTYGGDATDTDAGNGGSVDLGNTSDTLFLENTGTINSYGGAASGTSGYGGYGGDVDLSTALGDIRNSAAINSYGGAGIDGGGAGGDIDFYVDYTGDCVNSGALNTYGGATETGTGGAGGDIEYDTWQGGIRHNAAVNARGGSATAATGNGGAGGYIDIGSWDGSSDEPTPGDYTPIKDTEISGNIDLRGGDALAAGSGNGGEGGYLNCESSGDYFPLGQQIRFLGYKAIDTRGGNGNYGGDGGYVYGWQEYAYDEDQYFAPAGFRIDGVDIDTRGGNVVATATTTPAYGGDGGYVEFDMTTYPYTTGTTVPFDLPKLYLSGSINTSGGDNLEETSSYAEAGYVYVYAKAGIEIHGDITAHGGNDLGTTDGYGGDGNYVSLMADYGDVIVDGDIDMSGGDGALTGGSAGSDSDPVAATSQGIVRVKNITADGGDADPALAGSVGGDAQDFWLFAPQGPASVTFATLSAKGGTGETEGSNGVIMVNGFNVTP